MRLLQLCNVGRIAGGTAACAWTITRALPDVDHAVHFLSRPCDETRTAFAHCAVATGANLDPVLLRAIKADVMILHNVGQQHEMAWPAPCIQYVHSAGARAAADLTVCCSSWLAAQCPQSRNPSVLYQAVPKPAADDTGERRGLRDHLLVGRLCTPSPRKWPPETIAFYDRLAQRFPTVRWEFVGCPALMRADLKRACRGRVRFFEAGWSARSRLWRWDALLYHHPHLTESFGRTAAESMRAGCVPIVDRRGGFVEQVTPETGFLCDGESQFADALNHLQDAGVRRRMSRAALRYADERFSLQRFRSNLLDLIR